MGDVKMEDRPLDEATRQIDVNQSINKNYPNLSETFGNDTDKIYNNQPLKPDENEIEPVTPQNEYAYGNLFKKIKPEYDKSGLTDLQSDPYADYRHIAQDLTSDAYNKDILHSNNLQDFFNKYKQQNNIDNAYTLNPGNNLNYFDKNQMQDSFETPFDETKNITKDSISSIKNNKNSIYGVTQENNKKINLYTPSIGTLHHELLHAKNSDGQSEHLLRDKQLNPLSGYIANKLLTDPNDILPYLGDRGKDFIENYSNNPNLVQKYVLDQELKRLNYSKHQNGMQMPPSYQYANELDDSTKKILFNKAIDDNNGAYLATSGSAGHQHNNTGIGSVDDVLDKYRESLKQDGYDPVEGNVRFEKVKSLINLLKNSQNQK